MKIAVTGNIGTGKTTVCKLLEKNGYPVFYADDEAKKIAYRPDTKKRLIEMFGQIAFTDGVYNSKYISSIVFGYPKEMDKLNSIFKGLVIKEFEKFAEKHPVAIFESALIFEHNLQEHFDKVVGVYCDIDLIKKRVKARSGLKDNAVQYIMDNQMSSWFKMNLCNWSIDTTNGINEELVLGKFNCMKNQSLKGN